MDLKITERDLTSLLIAAYCEGKQRERDGMGHKSREYAAQLIAMQFHPDQDAPIAEVA